MLIKTLISTVITAALFSVFSAQSQDSVKVEASQLEDNLYMIKV